MLEKYKDKLSYNREVWFKVKVSPGAKQTALNGKMANGVIKISLAAKPDKGLANRELINFLASELGIRKYQVQIISGLTSANKKIKITR